MSIVLSEHLPLLASAPNGIQKLRGLILELAVRGKLVPQDPNDEPASELLKSIAEERTRQEAEGVCKKSKPVPLVDEDEQPYPLPSTWVWTRLGEITNFGQTDKDGSISDTTWVLDLEDIEKDTSVLLRKIRFAERQAKSDKNRFKEGDVLYGKLRPYLNKVIVADEEGVCTTEILPVRGYHGLFPRYLLHAVKRPDFLAYVNSKSYGMKMPRLGTEDGRLALFPLPPQAEQHRIVAKVDELMALCNRLEAEQADAASAHARLVETLLGTLTQSTDAADLAANWQRLAEHFDALFTTEASIDALKQTLLQLAVMGKLVPQDPNDEPASELLKRIAEERARQEAEGVCKKSKPVPLVDEDEQPFSLPSTWVWTRLGEITNFGQTDKGGGISDTTWILDLEDIEKDTSVLLRKIRFAERQARSDKNRFKEGDVLYGKLRPYLNKVIVADEEGVCTTEILPVRGYHGLLPRYLLHAVKRPDFLAYVNSKSYGMKMPRLGTEDGRLALFPFPPLAEQHRIVAKVDELMTLCDRLRADLVTARLRQVTLADTLIDSALKAA